MDLWVDTNISKEYTAFVFAGVPPRRPTMTLMRYSVEITVLSDISSGSVEIDGLKTGFAFQGLAFTLQERQQLGIHGLMPARFKTQEEQLELCKTSVERYQEDLNKYLYLVELQVTHILGCQLRIFVFCIIIQNFHCIN
jgi:hypothetical protein